jgi:hypothetical protein
MTAGSTRCTTPDGRYFVVRGRLWRMANPNLSPAGRQDLVDRLMAARRAVRSSRAAGDHEGEAAAHAAVDSAKHALGERGPVWWTDGTPDLNRHMARNTPYAGWFAICDGQRSTDPVYGVCDIS